MLIGALACGWGWSRWALCWGIPNVSVFGFFFLGLIPQRSLSPAWEIKVWLPEFWELSRWRGPEVWRVVLNNLCTWSFSPSVFSIRLRLWAVPCVSQSRNPVHSTFSGEETFSVLPCWEKDSHPVMGSGRMDLGYNCFPNTFLPTCLILASPTPTPTHILLSSRGTWCFQFLKLWRILLCAFG